MHGRSNARVQINQSTKEWEGVGNNSERPLVVAAKKAGFDADDLERLYPRLRENTFSSVRKTMSTVHDISAVPREDRMQLLGPQFAE